MNILILGGARNVGFLLTKRLIAAGHDVTHLHQTPRSCADVRDLVGDRSNLPAADVAVDFTAYRGDDVRPVLRAKFGHYVFISSGQVYLVRAGLRPPFREEDYDGPVLECPEADRSEWEYGIGKRECEDLLPPTATRLRLPMVNGERDHYHRIEAYLRPILSGQPVILPGGGREICRHVYSGSVVDAIAKLVDDPKAGAFNLAQDEEPTLAELVTMLGEVAGVRPRIVAGSAPSPFSTRWMSRLDPSKAKRELGFRHLPLREYLGRIVAHHLAV